MTLAVKVLLLIQGGFLIGVSAVIWFLYLALRRTVGRRAVHVMCISASYMLLAALVLSAAYSQMYVFTPWRTAMAVLAFTLGDYGMLVMLSLLNAERQQNHE